MLTKPRRGLVMIVSSPSGAGKTTICKKLIEEVNDIDLSVSVTTRKKDQMKLRVKTIFLKANKNSTK